MARFLQLHFLTFYPPSNLNRDDIGKPKSATIGGVPRLRISSQSLKRAWRTSDIFAREFGNRDLDGADLKWSPKSGIRTRRLGTEVIVPILVEESGFSEEDSREIAALVGELFGTPDDKKNSLLNKELVFLSGEEHERLAEFLRRLRDDKDHRAKVLSLKKKPKASKHDGDAEEGPDEDPLSEKDPKQADKTKRTLDELRKEILLQVDRAVDISMFGRMLAKAPKFNREAAVQVAHAITTHRVVVEDDYFTAVDDLKPKDEEEMGAGHIGELGFGSGVFYLYACVDRDLLVKNLGGDAALAATAIGALLEAAATVGPRGKIASFASHARAGYILAECGSEQPRTLAGAFLKPVVGDDLMAASVAALTKLRGDMDEAYGTGDVTSTDLKVSGGGSAKSLAEIVAFATSCIGA